MPVAPAVLADVLAVAGCDVPGLGLDDWAPSVQGAVGQVMGVRDRDGARYVLKVYPAGGRHLLDTELAGLRLLADVPGVPVPRPVTHGESAAAAFLLMTRLDGVRWADRRCELPPAELTALTQDVGRLLRRFHGVPGPHFGLLAGGPSWPSAWDRVQARVAAAVDDFVTSGGPPELAVGVRRLLAGHRAAFAAVAPVLCHNDFIDSNLLVCAESPLRLCGVVDLERASWDDPLSDLAQIRVHVRFHAPDDVAPLTEAYGVDGVDESRRLAVYEVLHSVRERAWIALDRPAAWRDSVAALDASLAERT